MRVSRTRFSEQKSLLSPNRASKGVEGGKKGIGAKTKRRIKRKTEFPIVAVVQKKRKVKSIKSQSFGILSNKAGATKQLEKNTPPSPFLKSIENKTLEQPLSEGVLSSDFSKPDAPKGGGRADFYGNKGLGENQSKMRQKIEASKPQKKSRASIDYKNIILLRNLITAEGKILPRRINKLTAKQQRYVQKAIKSARIMGLIPFINKSRPF